MTQVQSTTISDTTLDNRLRLVRDRSARGNATRRDWQRVAEIDPDLAYHELRGFMRRARYTDSYAVNPYERQSRAPGALIGFVLGTAAMIVLWIVLPYARENWMDFGVWRDIATGAQFMSTLLIPVGAIAGAWWGQRRNRAQSSTSSTHSGNPSFEELLDAFERTQNAGRTRVY